jgi:hypothetical protein
MNSDTVKNVMDMERLVSFMRSLDESGVERPYVVKRGYDFALVACRARLDLGLPATLTTLPHSMQAFTMEDAAGMLKMAVEEVYGGSS